jgi:hypothetical protein
MYIKFDMSSELRGDSVPVLQYYKEMVSMGAMNLNEVRAAEDMEVFLVEMVHSVLI